MAIDRTFEAALMKAVRGLEVKQKDLNHAGMAAMDDEALKKAVKIPTDERLWALAEALKRGWTVADVNKISRVDPWFLRKIQKIVRGQVEEYGHPVYKMVDTCAGEFESKTPYYYRTSESESDSI